MNVESSSPSERRQTGLALLAVVGAAALFGSTGMIAAIAPEELSAVGAGVWRSIVGGIVLVVAASIRSTPIWAYSLTDRWIWIGGLGVAGYQLAFFEAVDRTGVALGTLVTIGVGPLVAGVIDTWRERQAPPTTWLVGTAIAVAGVAVLTFEAADVDAMGIALAVVAACSFPTYGAAAQRLMRDRPFLPAVAAVFGAGAVLLSPLAVITAAEATSSVGSIAAIAVLGVATLALAYALWGVGLRSLSLSMVVTVTLVEPAVAASLAVLVLDEPFSAALVLGLILVAAGVRIGSRPRRVLHDD
ncbi:MAG: DMT family transporter [Ilumatobacter sp.]